MSTLSMVMPRIPTEADVLRLIKDGPVEWVSGTIPFDGLGLTGQNAIPPAPEIMMGMAFAVSTNGRSNGENIRFAGIRADGTHCDVFRSAMPIVAAQFISAFCDILRTGGKSHLHLNENGFLNGSGKDNFYTFCAVRNPSQLIVNPALSEEETGSISWMSFHGETRYLRMSFSQRKEASYLPLSNIEGYIEAPLETATVLVETLSAIMRVISYARMARTELSS